jgi:protein-tyrosine phosphatase
MKIIFVCLGNICRSPIAEGVLLKMAQAKKLPWIIESAGTNRYHKGGPADERSVKICAKRGVDISRHIARRFKTSDFKEFDVIYTMAADVVEEMQEFVTDAAQRKKIVNFLDEMPVDLFPRSQDVPDPWYGGEEGFAACFDLIERCCSEIIQKYGVK